MKPSKPYTNLAEMTGAVNHLLGLLTKAKELAENLKEYNEQNELHLQWMTEEAEKEWRSITAPERVKEAKRQAKLFRLVAGSLEACEEYIGMIY